MLVDGQRYPVVMSQTLYRWLMFDALRPVVDAGPGRWTHGGRVTYARLETLYTHGRQVEIAQNGRIVRLTAKDARTLMGLLDLSKSLPIEKPPRSSRELTSRLSWQIGDTDQLPGTLTQQARALRLIPLGNGEYLTMGGGVLPPGVPR